MQSKDLIKNLKQLKDLEAGGRPQASWLVSSKEILMSQIQPQPAKEIATGGQAIYYWQYFTGHLGLVFRPAMAVFLIVATMFGYSATVSMADASLPGDMFYSVKTTSEKVQLALTFPEDKNVQLQMDFVNRRVDELQQIVSQADNNTEKVKKVSETVKKITKDVTVVKEKLNKISAASVPKSDVTQVAKDIDTKTLRVSQGLVETSKNLSTEVKSGVAKDMSDAIKSNEETGAVAMNVIIKNYQSGDAQISGDEITTRVSDRIKNTEENIAGAATEVNKLITKIVNTASSSTIATVSNATSTLVQITEKPQQAQKTIEEAKSLLDQKDFTSALVKIQESKVMLAEVIVGTQIVGDQAVAGKMTIQGQVTSTSTNPLIKYLNADLSSSTPQTSETTNSLVK